MVNIKTDGTYIIEGEIGQIYLNSVFIARLLKDDKIVAKHLIMGMLLDSDSNFAKNMKIYGIDFFKLYIKELYNSENKKGLNPLFVMKGESAKDVLMKHVDYFRDIYVDCFSDRYIVVSDEVKALIDSSDFDLNKLEEKVKRTYFLNYFKN